MRVLRDWRPTLLAIAAAIVACLLIARGTGQAVRIAQPSAGATSYRNSPAVFNTQSTLETGAAFGFVLNVSSPNSAAFISGTLTGACAATTLNATAPTSTAVGNISFSQIITDANVKVSTVPSNWILFGVSVDQQHSVHAWYYYKAMTGSEPGTYTWTTSASGCIEANIIQYSGVSTNNPLLASVMGPGDATLTQVVLEVNAMAGPFLANTTEVIYFQGFNGGIGWNSPGGTSLTINPREVTSANSQASASYDVVF